jgi:hypothetical protein
MGAAACNCGTATNAQAQRYKAKTAPDKVLRRQSAMRMAIRESHLQFAIYAFCSPQTISGILDFCYEDFGYLPFVHL